MRIVVGLVFVLVSGVAGAQELTLGAHAGVSVEAGEATPVVGASLDVPLRPPLTLRVEAEYSQRGVTLVTGGAGADTSMSYLALPVSLRYFLSRGDVPIWAFAGTTLGALLQATRADGGAVGDLNGLDVTFDLGGGVGYRASPRVLVTVDARWSFGLSDPRDASGMFDPSQWSPRGLKVMAGVSFSL